MKTKEEIYQEYVDHPIKWMKENNCSTTKQITLRLMQLYYENNNTTKPLS